MTVRVTSWRRVDEFMDERNDFLCSVFQDIMTAVLEAVDLGTRESANPFAEELVAENEILETPANQHRFVGQVMRASPVSCMISYARSFSLSGMSCTKRCTAMRCAQLSYGSRVTGGHCFGHWPARHTIPYGAPRKGVGPPDEQGADPRSAGQRKRRGEGLTSGQREGGSVHDYQLRDPIRVLGRPGHPDHPRPVVHTNVMSRRSSESTKLPRSARVSITCIRSNRRSACRSAHTRCDPERSLGGSTSAG